MPGLLVGLVLTSLSPIASAQANPFQGIYAGKARIALGNRGFHQDYYPSRMIVLPDGHSILVTTQLPGAVTSSALSGNFKGNLFEGSSRARLNAGKVYNWATKVKIRFVGKEAIVEDVIVINPPPGYVHLNEVQVFYRIRS
jgi:hypothetical protein